MVNIRIRKFINIFRRNLIKKILVLGFIILSWFLLRQFFPPPITFWYIPPTNRVIPSPQKLPFDSILAYLKNCSLIVAACARDVENHLPIFRWNIENVASLFGHYHIFIGESDSADRTLTYLRQWAKKNNRVTIKTYGNISHQVASRPSRIAYCRNDLLDETRNSDLFRLPNHTFYMVADVDINPHLSQLGLLSNFDYLLEDWGALTASQFSGYYDIWALRNDVVNYDCWQIIYKFLFTITTLNRAIESYIDVHKKTIPSNHPLIPVNSSFGGAAIYQIKYLNGCRYSGYESHEICEHVPFNLCVTRNGGKMFINPKFQIA